MADDLDSRRRMIKVARLYHTHGMRQADIAKRLEISQSRVSRLLTMAEEASLVRTVVAIPPHIHAELEEQIEAKFGVTEVHVVDAVSSDEDEIGFDLAHAMAILLQDVTFEAKTIGLTSWSRTLQRMVSVLQPLRTRTERVVEMLGDLGPPSLQHDAANSTKRLSALTGGQPVFLRTPGVVPTKRAKTFLLEHDSYARRALAMLDDLDLALVGIGACEDNPTLAGQNFFSGEQFEHLRSLGAVGEVCLHFVDAEGKSVDSSYDDLVLGISLEQLRSVRRRWAVAGGKRKHPAIRAALASGLVDTLVTDTETAEHLVS